MCGTIYLLKWKFALFIIAKIAVGLLAEYFMNFIIRRY